MVVDRAKQLKSKCIVLALNLAAVLRAWSMAEGCWSPPSPEVNEHMTETVRT